LKAFGAVQIFALTIYGRRRNLRLEEIQLSIAEYQVGSQRIHRRFQMFRFMKNLGAQASVTARSALVVFLSCMAAIFLVSCDTFKEAPGEVPDANPDQSEPIAAVESYFKWRLESLREWRLPRFQQKLQHAEAVYTTILPALRGDAKSEIEGRLDDVRENQKKLEKLKEVLDDIEFETKKVNPVPSVEVTLDKPLWREDEEEWITSKKSEKLLLNTDEFEKWRISDDLWETEESPIRPIIEFGEVFDHHSHAAVEKLEISSLKRSTPESLARSVLQNASIFPASKSYAPEGVSEEMVKYYENKEAWAPNVPDKAEANRARWEFLKEHEKKLRDVDVEIQSVSEMSDRKLKVEIRVTTNHAPDEMEAYLRDESSPEVQQKSEVVSAVCNKVAGKWYVIEKE
jgi:hypothetical protein